MEGEAVCTLKDGRAQVILDAAGKYRFIKEFIKVRGSSSAVGMRVKRGIHPFTQKHIGMAGGLGEQDNMQLRKQINWFQ